MILSGVGFDIACGNHAIRTDVQAKEIRVPEIMNEIYRRISFGIGRPNNEPAYHEVLDKIHKAEFQPQRKLFKLAQEQLGTVGAGNHFVDLFEDAEGFLWIHVHFGSFSGYALSELQWPPEKHLTPIKTEMENEIRCHTI